MNQRSPLSGSNDGALFGKQQRLDGEHGLLPSPGRNEAAFPISFCATMRSELGCQQQKVKYDPMSCDIILMQLSVDSKSLIIATIGKLVQ